MITCITMATKDELESKRTLIQSLFRSYRLFHYLINPNWSSEMNLFDDALKKNLPFN
jgi:hypothetical protein